MTSENERAEERARRRRWLTLGETVAVAGLLIAAEAGARVGGLRGREPSGDMVVASAPGVFDALHDLLVSLDADAAPF